MTILETLRRWVPETLLHIERTSGIDTIHLRIAITQAAGHVKELEAELAEQKRITQVYIDALAAAKKGL